MDTKLHYDENEDKLTVERVQDIEPILDANKRQFDVDDKRFKSETMNHVARIPLIVAEKWCNDKGISFHVFVSDEQLLKRFLNDPENKFLRTKPGKL